MAKPLDLEGRVFDRLLVLKQISSKKKKAVLWLCQCSCGNSCTAISNALVGGKKRSCGCLAAEMASQRRTSHGMFGTRPYRCWAHAKDRCRNSSCKNYSDYGGRGICFTEAWELFEDFWKDMGTSYFVGASLDREDVNKGYCKENCRWIPVEQQPRNQRKRITNKSGVTGVFIRNIGDEKHWTATWYTLDGRQRYRKFSVNKYGYDEAFRLACNHRKHMIEALNQQGAGYTPTHGL